MGLFSFISCSSMKLLLVLGCSLGMAYSLSMHGKTSSLAYSLSLVFYQPLLGA